MRFRSADNISMGTNSNMSTGHETLVCELYGRSSRTVDDLPYTDDFEQLYAEFVGARVGGYLGMIFGAR